VHSFAVVSDKVLIPRASEAFAACKNPHSLKQISFALSVSADDYVVLRVGRNADIMQVFEAVYISAGNNHRTLTSLPSKETTSPERIFLPLIVHISPFTETSPFWITSFAKPPVSARPENLSKESSLIKSVEILISSIEITSKVRICVENQSGVS